MMRGVVIGVTIASVLAWAAIAGNAEALADQLKCQVFEIRASNDKTGVDKALSALAKKLKKPPFSSWKSFTLLKKHAKDITRMKALTISLVPGGKLSLLYRDKVTEEGKRVRLRLTFTLDDKNGKRRVDGTINLDSGDYYLIGGDKLKDGGTYILAITCAAIAKAPKPAKPKARAKRKARAK